MTMWTWLSHAMERAAGLTHSLLAEQATSLAQFQLAEMERFFALLVLGPVVGLPTAPPALALDLLPLMEAELTDLIRSTPDLMDMQGRLAGVFDIT
ncbi:MAG: hypothetical protein J7M25_07880 [Deltaproteobacteria bacterium]|nr:hypothetical protein [Deltaproteobacteria bacterium]